MDGCCFMCYYTECHQKTVIVGSNRDYNEKRMFMALAVALTGVSMVVAAGNGELKYRVKPRYRKYMRQKYIRSVSSRSRLPDRLP